MIPRTLKAWGTFVKKIPLPALALLITGCAQQTFTVQNKPAAIAPKETINPSFLRFWVWAEENCRCSQKFVAAQKILLKQKQQTFVNGLLGLYWSIILRWKRVCIAHSHYELPLIMSGLICTNSLMNFWVPSSCFCAAFSDQLSLRVK